MTYQSIYELIGLIALCSLVSLGVYIAAGFEGDEDFDGSDDSLALKWPKPEPSGRMILWWLRYYGRRIAGPFWSKPLYSCPPCMASLWSIYPTWVWMEYLVCYMPHDFFVIWPIVAAGTCCVNYIAKRYELI